MLSDPEIYAFYRRFRESCVPPMVNLGTVEEGGLWFYDGLCMMVTALVGDNSLIVAYDTYGTLEDLAARFRSAHLWLYGECPDPPKNLHVVFAAQQERTGNFFVRHFSLGDWVRIPDNVPLPPPKHKYPPGWGEAD